MIANVCYLLPWHRVVICL